MRSPNGVTPVVHFCANCDENPDSSRSRSETTSSKSTSSSSRLSITRLDTPPTELSSELSSPTFALPPETPESTRRREQSDRASTEIGNRLLKGWAMLAEECPNDECFGVPLVRPPKPGGEKDPRKECVICGGVYTTERDWAGRETLVAVSTEAPSVKTESGTTSLNADTKTLVSTHRNAEKAPASLPPSPSTNFAGSRPITRLPTANSALESSASSLENAIVAMSQRLNALASPSLGIMDPNSISLLAESISKTTQALSQVRELQWRERQSAASREYS
ncbi:hypothetical protein PM082_005342 [Marasmius tenuissimus]|nr:hypothetical protein PM082_005342 [Marasmius tenuissimus]